MLVEAWKRKVKSTIRQGKLNSKFIIKTCVKFHIVHSMHVPYSDILVFKGGMLEFCHYLAANVWPKLAEVTAGYYVDSFMVGGPS